VQSEESEPAAATTMDDLHALPKVRDSLSYLYVEHARIDRHEKSIAVWDDKGYLPVPAALLCVLMLGPGTTISHAAIQALADNNCLVVWCGEENVRFYAFGTGGTRSAAPLLLQAALASDEHARLEVVRRMYRIRFGEDAFIDKGESVDSLRGKEGFRMREAYKRLAREHGVSWTGRSYERNNWNAADPLNRALSCANSCLYGLCHAAILATGYSPGIGFIHTGKQLSFVYDIADLYKVEVTIPVAFRIAGAAITGTAAIPLPELERLVRLACRDRFRETRLLTRIVPDIQRVLGSHPEEAEAALAGFAPDDDPALPTELWTPPSERDVPADGPHAPPSSGSPPTLVVASADTTPRSEVAEPASTPHVTAPAAIPLRPAPRTTPGRVPPLRALLADPPAIDFTAAPAPAISLQERLADPTAVIFGPDPGCETPLRPPNAQPAAPRSPDTGAPSAGPEG
jgi:CRISPR-associated protein Cas1